MITKKIPLFVAIFLAMLLTVGYSEPAEAQCVSLFGAGCINIPDIFDPKPSVPDPVDDSDDDDEETEDDNRGGSSNSGSGSSSSSNNNNNPITFNSITAHDRDCSWGFHNVCSDKKSNSPNPTVRPGPVYSFKFSFEAESNKYFYCTVSVKDGSTTEFEDNFRSYRSNGKYVVTPGTINIYSEDIEVDATSTTLALRTVNVVCLGNNGREARESQDVRFSIIRFGESERPDTPTQPGESNTPDTPTQPGESNTPDTPTQPETPDDTDSGNGLSNGDRCNSRNDCANSCSSGYGRYEVRPLSTSVVPERGWFCSEPPEDDDNTGSDGADSTDTTDDADNDNTISFTQIGANSLSCTWGGTCRDIYGKSRFTLNFEAESNADFSCEVSVQDKDGNYERQRTFFAEQESGKYVVDANPFSVSASGVTTRISGRDTREVRIVCGEGSRAVSESQDVSFTHVPSSGGSRGRTRTTPPKPVITVNSFEFVDANRCTRDSDGLSIDTCFKLEPVSGSTTSFFISLSPKANITSSEAFSCQIRTDFVNEKGVFTNSISYVPQDFASSIVNNQHVLTRTFPRELVFSEVQSSTASLPSDFHYNLATRLTCNSSSADEVVSNLPFSVFRSGFTLNPTTTPGTGTPGTPPTTPGTGTPGTPPTNPGTGGPSTGGGSGGGSTGGGSTGGGSTGSGSGSGSSSRETDISITSLRNFDYDFCVPPGEILVFSVGIESDEDVIASVSSLDLSLRSSGISIDEDGLGKLRLPLPFDIASDEYWLRFVVSDDEGAKKVLHRPIIVNPLCR